MISHQTPGREILAAHHGPVSPCNGLILQLASMWLLITPNSSKPLSTPWCKVHNSKLWLASRWWLVHLCKLCLDVWHMANTDAMVESSVALKLDHKVWVMDKAGKIPNEESAFWAKNQILFDSSWHGVVCWWSWWQYLTHKNGNVGGEKLMVQINQWVLIQSSYSDSHFTIHGFTPASGAPVCCIIILACIEVEAKTIYDSRHGQKKWKPIWFAMLTITQMASTNTSHMDWCVLTTAVKSQSM